MNPPDESPSAPPPSSPPGRQPSAIEIRGLVVGYGKREVLHGVDLDVPAGGITAIIGHNGAGKSTLLRALFGLIPVQRGSVSYSGKSVHDLTPRRWLQRGVAYVPQGNRVFDSLSVRENLHLGAESLLPTPQLTSGVDRVLGLFPILRLRFDKPAGVLSGGEKQMLALSRALVLSPKVVLLDEPSLGLAPPLQAEMFRQLHDLCTNQGTTVLIVEQKVREILALAHRVYVFRAGIVSFGGPPAELRDEQKLQAYYF